MRTIIILTISLIFYATSPALAQVLEGEKHIFELEDTGRSGTDQRTSESFASNLGINSKIISGKGFRAILSYDDDHKNLPLVMTVSSDIINFGQVKPGEPVMRTLLVEMFPGSARGFQVLASQNYNLKSDKTEIPATSCNSGNCNQILSESWTLPLVYGFGFRCDNLVEDLCSPGMAKNHFKRYSNESLGESLVSIMSSSSNTQASAILSNKLNISGNQPQKGYQNVIRYIITPNL